MMTKRKRPPTEGEVVEKLLARRLIVEGKAMSAREAMIRGLYIRSLAGDIDASLDLQKLRDECGIRDGATPAGCLVVPEPISDEEFERMAREHQAPFREKTYGRD